MVSFASFISAGRGLMHRHKWSRYQRLFFRMIYRVAPRTIHDTADAIRSTGHCPPYNRTRSCVRFVAFHLIAFIKLARLPVSVSSLLARAFLSPLVRDIESAGSEVCSRSLARGRPEGIVIERGREGQGRVE